MAVSLNMNIRGKSGRRKKRAPMSEINVTPLVDVMLVLLIVFMVTAPLLTVGISVDLPKSAGKSLSEQKEPLTVSIDKDGQVFLMNSQVEKKNLVDKLKAIMGENTDARIYVRGDQALSYGEIMDVMGTISASGFTKVALVADMPKTKRS